jgi:hypothetical protein
MPNTRDAEARAADRNPDPRNLQLRDKLAVLAEGQRSLQEQGEKPVKVPPEWPAEIVCPNCENRQPTGAYTILGRRGPNRRRRRLLNRVCICPQPMCRHIFSPSFAYFRETCPDLAGRTTNGAHAGTGAEAGAGRP